jgi:hypothetical protein
VIGVDSEEQVALLGALAAVLVAGSVACIVTLLARTILDGRARRRAGRARRRP